MTTYCSNSETPASYFKLTRCSNRTVNHLGTATSVDAYDNTENLAATSDNRPYERLPHPTSPRQTFSLWRFRRALNMSFSSGEGGRRSDEGWLISFGSSPPHHILLPEGRRDALPDSSRSQKRKSLLRVRAGCKNLTQSDPRIADLCDPARQPRSNAAEMASRSQRRRNLPTA